MRSIADTADAAKPLWPLRLRIGHAASHALGWRETGPLVAVFALWVLCNPLFAIDSSNLIYSARTLADLDPGGVGRDLMFLLDGQSGFTVFTVAMRTLAQALGLANATLLVSAASVAVGFLGALVLASALTAGPGRYLIVACAATLSAQYGGYKLFSYAEVAATPRPFTEAIVLCSLAALVTRRHGWAAVAMVLASLLHPIMAASGVALLLCWLVVEDRRWLALVAALAGAALVAALVGVPPFDRLGRVIDPEWAAILKDRNPHLFPSLWPPGWIGRLATRIATLVIAAQFAPPLVRRLFLLVIPVGLVGLGAAFLLNEDVGLLLVLQAQTWRMTWLVFAVATAAAALCVLELWQRGGTARVALGFLALAWAYADYDAAAVLFALVATGVAYAVDPQKYAYANAYLNLVFAALVAWALFGLGQTELAILRSAYTPGDMTGEIRRTIALGFDYTPLAFAAAFIVAGRPRLDHGLVAGLAMLGLVLAGAFWDQRSTANIYFDSSRGAPDLERLVAARSGEIYWIGGGRQTWWWLHRPQWLAPIQGAGIVFSRDLALIYKQRTERAVATGFADPAVMAPLAAEHDTRTPKITKAGLVAFCSASDAPAWIISPLGAGPDGGIPSDVAWSAWSAPVAELSPTSSAGGAPWLSISRYAIIPCAGTRPATQKT